MNIAYNKECMMTSAKMSLQEAHDLWETAQLAAEMLNDPLAKPLNKFVSLLAVLLRRKGSNHAVTAGSWREEFGSPFSTDTLMYQHWCLALLRYIPLDVPPLYV